MPNAVAFADNSQLARNKQPALRITPRIKAAIEHLVSTGAKLDEAAREAGITTRALRLALEKPHVLQFYQRQCQVLRGSHHARNIHRLAQIRDAADNMPAVNAIKALEQLNDEQTNNKQTTTPGVTIRIVNVTATPAQHDIFPQSSQIEQTNNSEQTDQ